MGKESQITGIEVAAQGRTHGDRPRLLDVPFRRMHGAAHDHRPCAPLLSGVRAKSLRPSPRGMAAAGITRHGYVLMRVGVLRILGVGIAIFDRVFLASLVRTHRGHFGALDQLGLELRYVCNRRPWLCAQ